MTDEDKGAGPAPEHAGPIISDYAKLLRRLPAVVYVADPGPDGRWHYVSPQIERILGYSAAELQGNALLWMSRLHPEDRERVIDVEYRELAGRGEPGAVEYRVLHRDGHVVWIRDDAALVRDADGTERWHGVLSDITRHKRADAELQRQAAQQAAVARLGEHALEGARASELMQEAVACAAALLDVEMTAVLELLDDGEWLLLRAVIGLPESAVGWLRVPVRDSQSGHTIASREPVLVADWETEERFPRYEALRQSGCRSGVTVPIQGRGAPFGTLGAQSRAPREFSASEVDFLQALANVLADALERQATEDEVRHRALHDPLTGLPNRTLFLDRLGHALARLGRSNALAAVLFLDFDRFKLINDSLGHQVGDELLAAAAPRLTQAVRGTDTVARFGGDEFGILLEDIHDERDAIEMAERIASVFTRPFVLAGSEHFVTTSIGIALARGGERADELIRDADAAMYRAKERGSARYEVFDEAMRDRAIARLRVENDLRRALAHDELRVEYQPVVSLRDGAIVGVEALVRWQHPTRGLVCPGDFIGVAEENGLIEPIGRWVLEQACRQAAEWYRGRPDAAPIWVSVNLSASQFRGRGVSEMVSEVLRISGLPGSCLRLEITETAIVREVEALADAVEQLGRRGVQFVLDDFGTGYSSLAYVMRLPIDALKVDRSFVDRLGGNRRDGAITEAIVAMSRALSLQVIGEGVETARQLGELTRLGCDLAQGFFFSPALPAGEMSALLAAGLAPLPTGTRRSRA